MILFRFIFFTEIKIICMLLMLLICYVDVYQALSYCVKMLIDEYKEKICFMVRCSLDLKLKFIITLESILSYLENC